jgi:NADH:ubiquinone reductase (H+-translocating)
MHDILIVGSGYAGVWAAMAAARAARALGRGMRVAMVAPEPCLTARPRLYESQLAGEDARLDLTGVLRQTRTDFIAGRAIAVAPERPSVIVAAGGRETMLAARALVVASGSRTRPGATDNLCTIDDWPAACDFWARLDAMVRDRDGRRPVRLAVVGAGLTGLEAATEAAARHGAAVQVHLLDARPELHGFSAEAARYVREALARRGVRLHSGAIVAPAGSLPLAGTPDGTADLVLWCAGLEPDGLASAAPGPRAGDGRVRVTGELRQTDAPCTFWAGDIACAPTGDGGSTVMSCQHAVAMGALAGENAVRLVAGVPLAEFRAAPYVTCMALGPDDALLTSGWDRQPALRGADAVAVKAHIMRQLILPDPANLAPRPEEPAAQVSSPDASPASSRTACVGTKSPLK